MKVRMLARKLSDGRVLLIGIGVPDPGERAMEHNDELTVGSSEGPSAAGVVRGTASTKSMDKEYRGISAEVLIDMGLPDDPTADAFPAGIGPGRHFDLETEKLLDAFYEVRTAVMKGAATLEDLETAARACGATIEVRDIVMTEYRTARRHLEERAKETGRCGGDEALRASLTTAPK